MNAIGSLNFFALGSNTSEELLIPPIHRQVSNDLRTTVFSARSEAKRHDTPAPWEDARDVAGAFAFGGVRRWRTRNGSVGSLDLYRSRLLSRWHGSQPRHVRIELSDKELISTGTDNLTGDGGLHYQLIINNTVGAVTCRV